MRIEDSEHDFYMHETYEMEPKLRNLYADFCFRRKESFQAYINPYALSDAWDHTLTGLKQRVEIAGALIGCVYRDELRGVDFVEIIDVERQKSTGSGVSVDVSAEEWIRINNYVDRQPRYRGKFSIIGWYHSHPNMRAFMSETDAKTQERNFNLHGMVALVLGGNELNPDIRCFDSNSKEVPLYYIPEENDSSLRIVRGRNLYQQKRIQAAGIDDSSDNPSALINELSSLKGEVSDLRDIVYSLRGEVQKLSDVTLSCREPTETTKTQ